MENIIYSNHISLVTFWVIFYKYRSEMVVNHDLYDIDYISSWHAIVEAIEWIMIWISVWIAVSWALLWFSNTRQMTVWDLLDTFPNIYFQTSQKRDERKWSHQLYHRLYQHRANYVHIRDLRTRTSAQNKVEIFCSILLRIISSIIEFFQVKYFSLWKFATRFEIFPFGRHGMFPWQSTTRSISVRFWFSFSVIN